MDYKYIGLVGTIAGGKTTAAKTLEQLGYKYYSLSNEVRREATQRGLNLEREVLQNVGNDLRENFGEAVLAERIINTIALDAPGKAVIDGIRNPAELKLLKKGLPALIVAIDAAYQVRLSRYLLRAREEEVLTKEMFDKANNRDLGKGEGKSGQQVGKCLRLADKLINNDKDEEALRKEIVALVD
jgi:dephospho-CoA kinase